MEIVRSRWSIHLVNIYNLQWNTLSFFFFFKWSNFCILKIFSRSKWKNINPCQEPSLVLPSLHHYFRYYFTYSSLNAHHYHAYFQFAKFKINLEENKKNGKKIERKTKLKIEKRRRKRRIISNFEEDKVVILLLMCISFVIRTNRIIFLHFNKLLWCVLTYLELAYLVIRVHRYVAAAVVVLHHFLLSIVGNARIILLYCRCALFFSILRRFDFFLLLLRLYLFVFYSVSHIVQDFRSLLY